MRRAPPVTGVNERLRAVNRSDFRCFPPAHRSHQGGVVALARATRPRRVAPVNSLLASGVVCDFLYTIPWPRPPSNLSQAFFENGPPRRLPTPTRSLSPPPTSRDPSRSPSARPRSLAPSLVVPPPDLNMSLYLARWRDRYLDLFLGLHHLPQDYRESPRFRTASESSIGVLSDHEDVLTGFLLGCVRSQHPGERPSAPKAAVAAYLAQIPTAPRGGVLLLAGGRWHHLQDDLHGVAGVGPRRLKMIMVTFPSCVRKGHRTQRHAPLVHCTPRCRPRGPDTQHRLTGQRKDFTRSPPRGRDLLDNRNHLPTLQWPIIDYMQRHAPVVAPDAVAAP
ncbi:hypothetical protein Esti_004791 [Eimeria stiedai]